MSLNSKKSNTEIWDKNRGRIYSSKGGWLIGKGVFSHSYDMMNDFVGKTSYMQIVILNATGKMVNRNLADWFDAIHICLSWPDPRIWCNQIGALGGTTRTSVVAATVAGILATDSRSYGIKPLKEGLEFIQWALNKKKQGISTAEIVDRECEKHGGKPFIMGYARPIAKGDERVDAMERTAKKLGFEVGEHLTLAYDIESILLKKFDEGMNINGYMSAFLSDQGFTPEEIYRICSFLVSSGVTACYVDTIEKPEESFLPLRCDDLDYQGKKPRELP